MPFADQAIVDDDGDDVVACDRTSRLLKKGSDPLPSLCSLRYVKRFERVRPNRVRDKMCPKRLA